MDSDQSTRQQTAKKMDFPISPEISPKELLDRYPRVLGVFITLRLGCFGCPMGRFHTLKDVALEYNLDLERFLEKIAAETSISTKEGVMNENTVEKAKPFHLEKNVAYSTGSVVSKTILKKDTGNITLFAFDKDQGLSEHTAPFDAMVYILDGKAGITIDGKTQDVSAGESIIMPANIPHALKAVEPFKMLLVMIRGE